MQEYTAASIGEVDERENLTDMIFANAERFASTIAFRRRVGHSWVDVTAAQFAAEVTGVAKGLIAAGIETGDRIGLLAKTRYEWTLIDFAIWTAGAVTVPIYDTSSADQIEWILADSGARAVFVETDAHHSVLDGVLGRVDGVDRVWQIEGEPGAVAELTGAGAEVSGDTVRERRRSLGADDLATLVYTSGTTGRPKGCELTHRNLLAEVRANANSFPRLMQSGNSQLIFLPLAHVLARAIALTGVYTRLTMGHTPDVSNLLDDLRGFRPTFIVAVPRVFEKVYNSARQRAHDGGKGKIFDAAEAVAVEYSKAKESGSPSLALRAKHAVFDRLVYAKLRAALGGRCTGTVSGGAPLGERLAHFFRGVGIPVYEGYGLTETSAAAAVNTEQHSKIGTVGRPIAGTSVRIAEDGEVLVKSDVVFRGYWGNEEASATALTDRWFHTGDLGSIDSEGFLRITGRKKELIVTAGGKNVSPAVLEDGLRAHPLISQCMVVGDKQPFIAALITIDEEFLTGWKSRHGKDPNAKVGDLIDDPELNKELQEAVDQANTAVSHAESIKKFRVLPNDFTIDSGELTPSLKLRRGVVTDIRAEDIKAIYS
ncbi:AMP-dependent synthetase/ligase [Sciscionella sediminilitoris]|uniref:AMP-dependent synthetase/ligase n=1 Tax=Sciscionella sediminilitoris TaxID=1445613 RepID=UPI0004DF382A|nr:long-chain fatty acid--CoA ligase [Sciscionella sp. SE31]